MQNIYEYSWKKLQFCNQEEEIIKLENDIQKLEKKIEQIQN